MITLPNLGDLYENEGRVFFCYAAQGQFGQRSTQSVRMDSKNMNQEEQNRQDSDRLRHAISDWSSMAVAYPILARHGYMERTPNGYRCISPETVIARCRELLDRLSSV